MSIMGKGTARTAIDLNLCEAMDLILCEAVRRRELPSWKRDLYLNSILPKVFDAVELAYGPSVPDRRARVVLEGSVAHTTATAASDADFVVRDQCDAATKKLKVQLVQELRNQFDRDYEQVIIRNKQKSIGVSMQPRSGAASAPAGCAPDDLGLSMDLVFEWATVGKLVNEPETSDPFQGNPAARYAVQALKLLKDARVAGFGALSGCKVEGLVLWQQQELETQQLVRGLVRNIFHSVVERANGNSAAVSSPPAASTPINASNLFFGVISAFLPEVKLPGCPPSPNPAVRMRYIEAGIRVQQPTMLVNDLLDLGRFNACQNAAKYVLRRIKSEVAAPLADLLQRRPEVSPEDFEVLVDALGRILSPAAADPATRRAAGSRTAENHDGAAGQSRAEKRLSTQGLPPAERRGPLSASLISLLDVLTARQTASQTADSVLLPSVPSGDFQGAMVQGGQASTPQGQAVSIEATGATATASARTAAAVSGQDAEQDEEFLLKPQTVSLPPQASASLPRSEDLFGPVGTHLGASGSNSTMAPCRLMPAGDSDFWTNGLPRPSPWLMDFVSEQWR